MNFTYRIALLAAVYGSSLSANGAFYNYRIDFSNDSNIADAATATGKIQVNTEHLAISGYMTVANWLGSGWPDINITYQLVPYSPSVPMPSPAGFFYDNHVDPAGSPFLNISTDPSSFLGLLFRNEETKMEINLAFIQDAGQDPSYWLYVSEVNQPGFSAQTAGTAWISPIASISPIPEPSTYLAGLSAIGMFAWFAGRNRW
jgi:hypothetical protein